MDRVHGVIATIEPHDSVERYTALGVDCVEGEATITSPWTVRVGERTITTRNVIVAAGARPFVPPIPGIEDTGYLTSDTLWGLRELPPRLVVLGGGPIGSELAQCFARLGSKVTQWRCCRGSGPGGPEISDMVMRRFVEEGIDVKTGTARRNSWCAAARSASSASMGGRRRDRVRSSDRRGRPRGERRRVRP